MYKTETLRVNLTYFWNKDIWKLHQE